MTSSRQKESTIKINLVFLFLLLINALILGVMISQISISSDEAIRVLSGDGFVASYARFFLDWFGYNDYALRLPFLAIHLCNLCLIFALSKLYLNKPKDALWCAWLYAFLPGIDVTALLVGKSVLLLFFALLLCYVHLVRQKWIFFALSSLGIFLDSSFSIIFLALFLHSFRFKHHKTLIFALIGFSINMYLFTPIGGSPRGYFLDTVGLLAILYSPFVFVYFIYTLYRGIIKKEDNLMLYIGTMAIIFTLLMSLRQEVDLFGFLPLSAVALPVMMKDLFHNIRLRLPIFRRSYIRRVGIILIPLVFEIGGLFGNKLLFLTEPNRHFLSNFYFAKELAQILKSQGITSLKTSHSLQNQLQFYGIHPSHAPILQESKKGDLQIIYLGKKVKSYKINP